MIKQREGDDRAMRGPRERRGSEGSVRGSGATREDRAELKDVIIQVNQYRAEATTHTHTDIGYHHHRKPTT